MSDIRARKSLTADMPEPKASASGASSKEAKPRKTRAIIMTCVFVVLLALVALRYAWPDSTPEIVEPEKAEQPMPPQPGQPRNNTPPTPGQQPIPHDIISG